MSTASQQTDQRAVTKVLKSVAWMMFGRVMRLALGVGVYVLVARHLQPVEFGVLVSALALMSILEIAGRLGLSQVALRDIVRDPDATSKTLGTVIAVRALCALLGIAIATIFGSVFFADAGIQRWVFPLVALSLLPASLSQSLILWFQSRTEARVPVLMEIVSFVVSNAARLILLMTNGSLLAFAVVPLLSQAVGAGGLLIAIRRREGNTFVLHPSGRFARQLLRDNWPLVFGQLAGVIFLKIDQVMLVTLAGAREVGNYAAALRLSEVWYFVPAALCISLKPTLTRLRESNPRRYQQVLQCLFSVMTLMALGIAIPMTLLAPVFVRLLFGSTYAGASLVLSIHIWAALFVFWQKGQSEWMINEGHLKFGLCRALLGAISNIGLNCVLIPDHGAVGAAVATLVSCFLIVVPANLMFAPARPILALQLKSLRLAGLFQNVRRWTRPASAAQAI